MIEKFVGIRKAKEQLSKLLKVVQTGHEIILTDRGRPVAKLVPMPTASLTLRERIRQMEDQGLLDPESSSGWRIESWEPIKQLELSAQELLQDDRDAG